MASTFIERRREFREPVERGLVLIGERAFRLVNWTSKGVLIGGFDDWVAPRERIEADFVVLTPVSCLDFRATLEIARVDPTRHEIAAIFAALPDEVRAAIDRHFGRVVPVPAAAVSAAYSGDAPPGAAPRRKTAVAEVAERRPEPRSARPAPVAAGSIEAILAKRPSDDQLAAMASCLSAVKTLFAKRFHPDAGGGAAAAESSERTALRSELFQAFWQELEEAERQVRDVVHAPPA